jgi:hypothetical protein
MIGYNIIDYIENSIKNKYYIMILIEDIMMYYNFFIDNDNVKNDIRTIILKNNKKETITIDSIIISYSGSGEQFKQQNKIIYSTQFLNTYEWEYVGSCYKFNKSKI